MSVGSDGELRRTTQAANTTSLRQAAKGAEAALFQQSAATCSFYSQTLGKSLPHA